MNREKGGAMKLGMIGLGRMGGNMALRLLRAGHSCVVYNRSPAPREKLVPFGAIPVASLEAAKEALGSPAVVWLMLPAGEVTDDAVTRFSSILTPGDTLVDGGNSHYKDGIRHARLLREKGIRYLDAGTSGGIWGLERGYSLMIGGDREAATALDPIFASLAPGPGAVPASPNRAQGAGTADRGYLYCGGAGSGHFVKMIHNGIEYGMMQSLAEGFQLLQGAARGEVPEEWRYRLDLREIAEVWRRGSVVSSWLLDLIAIALNEDPELRAFSGRVADSGEGRWTVQAALDEGVPATVLSASLFARFRSREEASFSDQLLSAMRAQFGGHREAPPEEKAS
jgi:6-phosphogluconate dehydrogenase